MSKAKDHLNQIYYLDQLVNAKVEQLNELKALAVRLGISNSDMPGSPNRRIDKLEMNAIRVAEAEYELNQQVSKLLDEKTKILETIEQMSNVKLRTILELRYLCFYSWDKIADLLGLRKRYLFELHQKALEEVENFF